MLKSQERRFFMSLPIATRPRRISVVMVLRKSLASISPIYDCGLTDLHCFIKFAMNYDKMNDENLSILKMMFKIIWIGNKYEYTLAPPPRVKLRGGASCQTA